MHRTIRVNLGGKMIELATHAAFLRGQDGGVCITLSDPEFVQSDSIIVDRKTHRVFAVCHEAGYLLGHIPADMAQAFVSTDHVLLSGERGDGTLFELTAPLSTAEWREFPNQIEPQFGATAGGWAQTGVIRVGRK